MVGDLTLRALLRQGVEGLFVKLGATETLEAASTQLERPAAFSIPDDSDKSV
jgi:hypothetical protein